MWRRLLSLATVVVLSMSTVHADLRGLIMSETSIIEDNYGLVNLDDVDARDELRTEVSKRNVVFANNFVSFLATGQWRTDLQKLIDPADVAAFPSSIVSWLENLTPIEFDGAWDSEDQVRLDKIRTAMALKGLLDFGVPGKRRPAEVDGEIVDNVVDAYLIGATGGADPAFLQKLHEYETNYQRMCVIKVEGTDGRNDAPPLDVEGAIISMMNAATSDIVNPPSQGDVDAFVESVAGLFADPTEDGWTLNPGWWNLTRGNGALVEQASQYNIISGAQLLGIKMTDIDPATATADEIIEALSTATKYSIEYNGRVYVGATGISGLWASGSEMNYSVGSVDATGLPTNTIRVLERVGVKEEPLQILAADHSEVVSGLGTEIPELPISEELLLLIKLVQAFQEPAENVPATEGNFEGPSSGGSSAGNTFSGGGSVGGSF